MDRQEKQPAVKPGLQKTSTTQEGPARKNDDDERSYPGRLDSVEGEMNNGELGGSLKEENEEQKP